MTMGRKLNRPLRQLKSQNRSETKTMKDLLEGNAKLTLLSAVNAIVTLAEDSKLNSTFFQQADRFVTFLSEKQGVTKIQAVMLALFIESSAAGDKSDFSEIARYVDCNNVQVLQYKGDVDDLVRKGVLRMIKNHIMGDCGYAVYPGLLESFAKDEAFQRKSYKNATGIEFFHYVYDITHLRYEEELSTEMMLIELNRLIDENPQLSFVKGLTEEKMSVSDRALLCHMCRHLILCGTAKLPISHMTFLFDASHQRHEFGWSMSAGQHFLVREGWVENAFSDGLKDNEEYQLTAKAKEVLLKDYDIKLNENKSYDVLESDGIATKTLFFANDVEQQINSLTELLGEENYHGICDRLKQRGLRQGFACLFYGEPGTGKTESVLQIAKKTGRDIMQVNISEVKSMWVGESEKNVKAIFSRYRAVAKQSRRVPILLFNEADAVIGKRMEGADRSVDKMENSIQNIILQEMESLEGIMIATTNLVQNMDAAFERRFLYKVKFNKPELSQRTNIWQSMMPRLSLETAVKLASQFDFSGGQIENITRKCDIESILYGDEYITDEKIMQYCQEEKIVKMGKPRIGFV